MLSKSFSPNQVLVSYLHDSARYTYAPRTRDLLTAGTKVQFMPMYGKRSKVMTDFNTGEVKAVGLSQNNGNRAYTYMGEAEYAASKASFLKTAHFKSPVHMIPEDLVRMTRVMEIDAHLDHATKVAYDFYNKKIDDDNFDYQNKNQEGLPSLVLQHFSLKKESKTDPDIDMLRPQLMYLLSQNKDLMQSFSDEALENMTTSLEKAKKMHGIFVCDDAIYIGENNIKPLHSTFDINDMTACVNRFGLEPLKAMGEEKAHTFWHNVSALSLQDESMIADIRQQEKEIFKYT